MDNSKLNYLEEEDDVPDEAQDDGGVSISDVGCVDAHQLHLKTLGCVKRLMFQTLNINNHCRLTERLTFLSSKKDRTLAMLLSLKIR